MYFVSLLGGKAVFQLHLRFGLSTYLISKGKQGVKAAGHPSSRLARLSRPPASLHYKCPPAALTGPDVQRTGRSPCGRAAWSPYGSVTPANLYFCTGECGGIKVS